MENNKSNSLDNNNNLNIPLNLKQLENIIEAILFASGEAVSLKNISLAIGQSEKFTQTLINSLKDKYTNRGIKIIQTENNFQMCTNPEYFSYIKDLYNVPQKKNLSQALLETLSIIAYKQPITRISIDYIRGVNCEHALNSLIKYNLIEEKGRLDAIGRPILFGTTSEFLKYFGFTSLNDMPNIDNIDNIDDINDLDNIDNIDNIDNFDKN